MSKRFEGWARNAEAIIVAAVLLLIGLAYLMSR
jgi:hypothetical protein